MTERRRKAMTRRFNQGIDLALGNTSTLRSQRRSLSDRDTVGEAWASVGMSLARATSAADPQSPSTTNQASSR